MIECLGEKREKKLVVFMQTTEAEDVTQIRDVSSYCFHIVIGYIYIQRV